MPETTSLSFENGRSLANLYSSDNLLLEEAEKAFEVKLASRDALLHVEGSEKGQQQVKELFRQLHVASQNGIKIRRHEFRYALDAIKSGQAEELEQMWATQIQTSPKKRPVNPKTFGQKRYLDMIEQHDLTFGIGCAGSGKTFLAMAMGVQALRNGDVKRIVLTRPAVEAGEALGYLPGDLQEKIFPYLRPLYDALYDMVDLEEIQKLMDKGVIEIAPLAYMRGRTLANAFVILDEGQNATTEQMFMFLTRLGQSSKCVVTGDPTQIDLPRNAKSGLIEALQALENTKGIGFLWFEERDIIRHELVGKIVEAYKLHRGVKQTSMTL